MLTKDAYIGRVVPYRMQAVAVFNIAARYAMSWQTPPALEMRFDEKIVIRGRATAFTNPAIEAGIMHCRALLEFLGLRCDRKDPARLAQRLGKMEDDFVIEDFVGPTGPLSKVSVEQALMPYPGPKEEAEMALASVIHAANKGIAHMTSGHVVSLSDLRLYEIASRGVPVLVSNYFYVAQGLEPPKYEIPSTR